MDKLKYIKLENEDGTYSSPIPLAVDSDHVNINGNTLTSKLSTLATKDEVQALASGSPAGVYATAIALKTANPDTGVYIVTENGHIYSWTKNQINEPIDLGLYQAIYIDDNAIKTKNINSQSFGSKYNVKGYGALAQLKTSHCDTISSNDIKKISLNFKIKTIDVEANPLFYIQIVGDNKTKNLNFMGEYLRKWAIEDDIVYEVSISSDFDITDVFTVTNFNLGLIGANVDIEYYIYDFELYVNDNKIELDYISYTIGANTGTDLTSTIDKGYITTKNDLKNALFKISKEYKQYIEESLLNYVIPDNEIIIRNLVDNIQNVFSINKKISEELEIEWNINTFYNQSAELITLDGYESYSIDVEYGDIYYVNGITQGSCVPALYINNKTGEIELFTSASFNNDLLIEIPKNVNKLLINSRMNMGASETKVYKINFLDFSDEIKVELKEEIVPKLGFTKYYAIGDSITYGGRATMSTYENNIGNELNIEVVNLGVSSSGYKQPVVENFTERIEHITNYNVANEVITVMGGINDRGFATENFIGQLGDTTMDTYYGALYTFFNTLFTKYPGCRIGLITPIPSNIETEQYQMLIDAQIETAKLFNVPYLDLHTKSNLRPNDETFRNLYFKEDGPNANGSTDGTHPNTLGHRIITNQIKEFVKTL